MIYVCALLHAAATSVWVSLVLAFTQGGLSPRTASLSLGCGMLVAAYSIWADRRRTLSVRALGPWEWAAAVVFSLFSLRAFLWLVFSTGDEIRVLSPNNLGDLSLHLTYIRELANGVPFWPANPIVAGTTLTYPLGVDLIHSLAVLVGTDIYRTFIWMGLIGAAATGFALWRWGGAFTVAGFLCNGGLAAVQIFAKWNEDGSFAGLAPLAEWHLDDFQATAAWKSIPLALFVTQRGFLFALPAGLVLLSSWRERFFESGTAQGGSRARLPLWGEVLLYASMPVFHLHTFIFLSLLLLAWFFLQAPARKEILLVVGLAFIPATLLTFEVTAHFGGPSNLGWQPGWMQSDPDFLESCAKTLGATTPLLTVPIFWLYNFGLLPFLIAAVGLRIFRVTDDAHPVVSRALHLARCLLLPAVAIFVLCCFVKFATWEWDNTKLMIWSYLLVLPLLWEHLLSRWRPWAQAIAIVALFSSGAVSLVGGLDSSHRGFEIARYSELDPLEVALRKVPPTERIVGHPNYNHPLLLLGRPLALGYTGHVWSHGYEFAQRQQTVNDILDGKPGWREKARALGCRYLFWGREEAAAHGDSAEPWAAACRAVFVLPQGTLYDLQSAPTGG